MQSTCRVKLLLTDRFALMTRARREIFFYFRMGIASVKECPEEEETQQEEPKNTFKKILMLGDGGAGRELDFLRFLANPKDRL